MAKPQPGIVLVLIVIFTALGACASPRRDVSDEGQVPVTSEGYRSIDAAGLASMLQNKDFQLVNVHIPYAGEIGGTDVFVPYDKVSENLARLPVDKNARIVLYCRSGMMSEIAARELVELGYKNILDLQGGMAAWERAGNALLHRPGLN